MDLVGNMGKRRRNMKLQIALDDISMEAAMELLGKVKEYADIAEVGTPFLMEYGMEAVRRIHAGFPGLSVLCDGKIMDAGGYEAELAFRAGADYVTVLAVTDDRTILDVAAAAKKYGKKTVADMICVENLKERSRTAGRTGRGCDRSPHRGGRAGRREDSASGLKRAEKCCHLCADHGGRRHPPGHAGCLPGI